MDNDEHIRNRRMSIVVDKNIQDEGAVQWILSMEDNKPSKAVFEFLFQSILGAALGTKKHEIDIFKIFFGILPNCEPKFQIIILKKLNTMASNYTRVKSYCCRKKWLIRLLNMVPTITNTVMRYEILELIEKLAMYNITVEELKVMFRLMKSKESLKRPIYWPLFLKVLKNVGSKPTGPSVYFDLNGIDSGIILPELKKFPVSSGYTFCAWVRIESFENTQLSKEVVYCPRLFSFETQTGLGIQAFFQNKFLTVQTKTARNKVDTQRMTFPFQTNQWYFITVAHTYHMISKSTVEFFVDGQTKGKGPLSYPNLGENFINNCIGNNLTEFYLHQPLIGQLGAIYLFSSAIVPQAIQAIYQQGPNLITEPQKGTSYWISEKNKVDIYFSYNPRATEGALILETSSGQKYLHATKLEGVREVKLSNINECVSCTGGPAILFPLFMQLDLPLISSEFDDESDEKFIANPSNTIAVVHLITTVLSNSITNQDTLYNGYGFHLLGFLFQKLSPLCWNIEAISALENLANSIYNNEKLYRVLFLNIYLNFEIWINTSFNVQKSILQQIAASSLKNPPYFRKMITVQRLIDILRQFYWFQEEDDSFGKDPMLHSVTREVIGQRPSQGEIIRLRESLLQIIRVIAQNGLTFSETNAIVTCLLLSPDHENEGIDLLQMMLSYLNLLSKEKEFNVCLHLVNLGGLNPFINLLKRKSASLRVWCLKLIGKLLEKMEPNDKAKQLQTIKFSLMKQHLQYFPLSKYTYFSLLEILLENIDIIKADDPLAVNTNQVFKNPSILPVIFELLSISPNTVIVERALKNFVDLLTTSASNRNLFIVNKMWQSWILGILSNSKPNSVAYMYCFDIITLLHHHSLNKPNGHKILSQTQTMFHYFADNGFVDSAKLCRRIHYKLLRSVLSDNALLSQSKNIAKENHIFDNFIIWISLVEESLFTFQMDTLSDHKLLPIYRSSEGLWEDYQHAQEFLKFLDEFHSVARKIETVRQQDLQQNSPSIQPNPNLERNSSTTISSPEKSNVNKQSDTSIPLLNCTEAITRPMLRFTLHTLYEADTFLNTQLIGERIDKLNKLDSRWKSNFENEKKKSSIMEAMDLYKKHKIQEWEQEKQKTTNTLKESLSRLNFLIKGVILIGKNPDFHLFYILTFLYKSMKRSYGSKGVGAELILILFKEILLLCKNQNFLHSSLSSVNDEQLVTLFMKNFSFPDKDFAMNSKVDEACEFYITQEQLYSSSVYSTIEMRKELETKSVKSHIFQEQQLQEKYISVWDLELDKFKKMESNRRYSHKVSYDQKNYLLTKTWTRLMRSLNSPRGPWASIEWEGNTPTRVSNNSVIKHWKIDPVETNLRLRILFKPNYNFDDHSSALKELSNSNENSEKVLTVQKSFYSKNIDWSQFIVAPEKQEEPKEEEEKEESNPVIVDPLDSRKETQQLMDTNAKMDHTEVTKIFRTDCQMVKPMQLISGILEINKQSISFYALNVKDSSLIETKYSENKKWDVNNIKDIQTRNYLHERTALEIFFNNNKAYFFNFPETDRNIVYKKVIEAKPANIASYHLSAFSFSCPSPSTLLKKLGITERWRKREISNFDYLMAINTIAGRTYNDLSQYPVFPWILKDYTSPKIDLDNPNVYRDLSKPIGALNPDRLEEFKIRFKEFDDPVIPKFHYGSHYSSAAIVLYYLIRVEPYTTHGINLQGGFFDVADRMFLSIANSWQGCTTNSSDVKELIPEFFYSPEFLVNKNNTNFGKTQKGQQMSDVWLPTWAKSAEHFVEINRQALESEYVSAHLNEWIDLIFGYKQRGNEAITANNVFYYLTYEGSVDLKAIQDPQQKASAKSQIREYGQTPKLLFSKPHPKRNPLETGEVTQNIKLPEEYNIVSKSTRRILYMKAFDQKILTIYENGSVALHKMALIPDGNLPFKFEIDKNLGTNKEKQINLSLRKEGSLITTTTSNPPNIIKGQQSVNIQYEKPKSTYSNLFAVSPDIQNLISCGNWENSFVCSEISPTNITPIFTSPSTEHLDRITCLALGQDGNTLVTGSVDNTCLLWKVGAALSGKPTNQTGWFSPIDYLKSSSTKKSQIASQLEPTFRLCGHDDKITCASISTDLGVVVSGSRDGTCIVWKCSNARYLCTLFLRDVIVDNSNVLQNKCYVEQVLISSRGRIISKTYNLNKDSPKPYYNVFVHTTYGTLQSKQQFNKRINTMQVSENGLYLVLAVDSNVLILDPNDLQLINSYECDSPIFSFEFIHEDSYLLVGKDNGRISILPMDNWKKF